MASEHPFQTLFEIFGRFPAAHAEAVNRRAYEHLGMALSLPVESPGRCILLRAPRAGHGKTHLLSRVQHQLTGSHEFIPIQAPSGSRIDAVTVTEDALRRLVRPLPASGGLCVLDFVVRRLFASALQPLVRSGEVPCQDREGALAALRNRPLETFDFHHPNAVTAHWARENFEILGPRLTLELSQRSGQPIRETGFWVNALFKFASTPVDDAGRVRTLAEAATGDGTGDGIERLAALLGLLASMMRVVLVADDLEGFSADETAALKFAAFVGSLRQLVERLDVIISLNQDIWQSAFLPRLSGGLADRLSEVTIDLVPLSESELVALLDSRAPGLGATVLQHIPRDPSQVHPRGMIRAAGIAWMKAAEAEVPQPRPLNLTPPVIQPEPVEEIIDPIPEIPEDPVPETPDAGDSWPDPAFPPPSLPPVVEVLEPEPIPTSEQETSVEEPPAELASEPDSEPASYRVVDSPFSIDDSEDVPVLVPILEPQPFSGFVPTGSPPAPESRETSDPAPPPADGESDRVDDLLRQFRDRYGRGSL